MEESTKRRFSKAEEKAQAVAAVETLIAGGTRVRPAVEAVAYQTGISETSLFTFLRKTRGVPLDRRESALARKPAKPR